MSPPFIAPKPYSVSWPLPRGLLYSPPRHPSKHLPFAVFESVQCIYSPIGCVGTCGVFLIYVGVKTSNIKIEIKIKIKTVDHFALDAVFVGSSSTEGGVPRMGSPLAPICRIRVGYPFVRCFILFFHVNIPRRASMLGLTFPNRRTHTPQSLALPSKQSLIPCVPYPLALNGLPDSKRIRVSASKEVSRVTLAPTRNASKHRSVSLATCQHGGLSPYLHLSQLAAPQVHPALLRK